MEMRDTELFARTAAHVGGAMASRGASKMDHLLVVHLVYVLWGGFGAAQRFPWSKATLIGAEGRLIVNSCIPKTWLAPSMAGGLNDEDSVQLPLLEAVRQVEAAWSIPEKLCFGADEVAERLKEMRKKANSLQVRISREEGKIGQAMADLLILLLDEDTIPLSKAGDIATIGFEKGWLDLDQEGDEVVTALTVEGAILAGTLCGWRERLSEMKVDISKLLKEIQL